MLGLFGVYLFSSSVKDKRFCMAREDGARSFGSLRAASLGLKGYALEDWKYLVPVAFAILLLET
jgi:hypothetical protein